MRTHRRSADIGTPHHLRIEVHTIAAMIGFIVGGCGGEADEPLRPPPVYQCESLLGGEGGGFLQSVLALEASGPSTLLDIGMALDPWAPVVLGVAPASMEFAHHPITVEDGVPALFLASVLRLERGSASVLLRGRGISRGAILPRHVVGWMVAATVVGDATLIHPHWDSGSETLDLPDDGASMVVFRIDPALDLYLASTVTGDLDGARLLMVPGPDGTVLLSGAASSGVKLATLSGSVEAHASVMAAGAHAWFARLNRWGSAQSVTILDGDASSIITGATTLDDDRIAIVGRFGGVGARTVRFGQASGAPTLTTRAGQGEEVMDGFVAVLSPAGEVEWTAQIESRNQDDPIAVAATKGGLVTQTVTAVGDTVYVESGREAGRIAAPYSLATWTTETTPHFVRASAMDDYRMLQRHLGVARYLSSPPSTPGEVWALARLGDDGAVENAAETELIKSEHQVFDRVAPGCGSVWVLGGNPVGKPDILSLPPFEYDIPEPHIVVTEVAY